MARGVEAFALVFFFHAQADRQIDQLEEYEADHARPADGDEYAEGLRGDLAAHVIPIDSDAAERGRDEYAGSDRTDDAADTVNAEDVQ